LYPGHDKPPKERKQAERSWSKKLKTMGRESNAMDAFTRLAKPGFCHEITAEDRDGGHIDPDELGGVLRRSSRHDFLADPAAHGMATSPLP
jgi:hypothetical protein